MSPKILRMTLSFMKICIDGTVQYGVSSSDPFPIKSAVKRGCVLAPTLFGVFFKQPVFVFKVLLFSLESCYLGGHVEMQFLVCLFSSGRITPFLNCYMRLAIRLTD